MLCSDSMQTFLLGKSMLNSTPAGGRKLGCGRGKQDPSTLKTKEVSLLNHLCSARHLSWSQGAASSFCLRHHEHGRLCCRPLSERCWQYRLNSGPQVSSSPRLSSFLSPQSFLSSLSFPLPTQRPSPQTLPSLPPHFSVLELTFQFSHTEPSSLPL